MLGPYFARTQRQFVLLGVLCAATACDLAHAGKLGNAAAAVQADSGGGSSSRRRDRSCDGDDGSFIGDLIGDILGSMFGAVLEGVFSGGGAPAVDQVSYVYGPETFDEFNHVLQRPAAFAAYPYENNIEGYLVNPYKENIHLRPDSRRVWVEYGTNYDDIQFASTSLLWEGGSGFAFDASWRTYWEDLGAGGTDDLTWVNLNASYRFVQSRRGEVRLGVSVPFVGYGGDIDAGFGGKIAGEYYPIRPVVVAFETELAKAGAATLFHARSTVGLQLRHVEVYTGIDHVKLGGSDLTTVVSGLQLWW